MAIFTTTDYHLLLVVKLTINHFVRLNFDIYQLYFFLVLIHQFFLNSNLVIYYAKKKTFFYFYSANFYTKTEQNLFFSILYRKSRNK
jgi:hypothetical protein